MILPRVLAVTVDTSRRIRGFGGEEVPVEYEYDLGDGLRSRSVIWMTTENAVKEVLAHAEHNTERKP